MAKPLRTIVPNSTSGYVPKAEAEQDFVDQHEVEVTADANGNDDKLFKGSTTKASYPRADDADADANDGDWSEDDEDEIEEDQVNEKLAPGSSPAEYIHDFAKSDNKKFSGDSKKQRIHRALGAYYGRKNGVNEAAIYREEEELNETPTRKDFRQVANTVRAIEDPKKRQEFADHHAKIYSQQNPRFSFEKWHAATGTQYKKAVKEDVEQIDEISRGLALRYVSKAAPQVGNRSSLSSTKAVSRMLSIPKAISKVKNDKLFAKVPATGGTSGREVRYPYSDEWRKKNEKPIKFQREETIDEKEYPDKDDFYYGGTDDKKAKARNVKGKYLRKKDEIKETIEEGLQQPTIYSIRSNDDQSKFTIWSIKPGEQNDKQLEETFTNAGDAQNFVLKLQIQDFNKNFKEAE
jgi:hypothetical protein